MRIAFISLIIAISSSLYSKEKINERYQEESKQLENQKNDPKPETQWYEKADSLYKLRKFDEAFLKLDKAASFFKDSDTSSYVKAVVKQGQILVKQRQNEKALALFEEVEDLSKDGDQKVYSHLLTQKGFALANTRQISASKEVLLKAKELIMVDSIDHYLISYIDVQFFLFALQDGRVDLAKTHIEKALFHAQKSENDDALRNSLNKTAMFNWRMGNHAESLKYLEKEKKIISEKFGSYSPEMAIMLRNMAVVASSGHEIEKAVFLVNRALELITRENDSRTYFLSYSSLSNYHNRLGDYDLALTYSDTALNVASNYGFEDSFLIETIVYRTTCLRKLNEFDQLKLTINRLLEIGKNNDLSPLKEANIYRAVSRSYLSMEDYELSLTYIEKAIDLVKNSYGPKTRYLNDLLVERVDVKRKTGQYDEALTLLEEPFKNIVGSEEPSKEDFNTITLSENFATALEMKADLLYLKSNQTDIFLLEESLETLELASDFINEKRKKINGESFGASIRQSIKEQAIECLFTIYNISNDDKYLGLALSYSEIARSDQLMLWLTEAEKFGKVGLGKKDYESRKSIRQSIDMFEQMVGKLGQSDSLQVVQLNDTLRVLSDQYDKINLNLKKQNENFYSLVYDNSFSALDQNYERFVNEGETSIIFNESAGNWYAIVLGKKNKFIKLDSRLPDLNGFREALMNPQDTSVQSRAKQLYQYFLEPVIDDYSDTKLNFLTDKSLSFIPLELLINPSGEYLFQNFDIRYSYTMESRFGQNEKSSSRLLAIAPDFSQEKESVDPIRSELSSIPGADKEARDVSSIFSSTTFLGNEASEKNFKNNASDFGIIHLATHAVIDDNKPKNSRLVFQKETMSDSLELDGYLHAYEIYNLDLNAQLVTLSACNTGFGKIQKGEGVMSLSRAFAYAGVPSTVVSLWPASDKSTPELMKYFYQNLKDGQTKDVALNNARKQYLATAKGKARHPFYWGGFVLIGDNSPIEEDRNMMVWLLMGTVVIVLIATVYRRRRNRSYS